MGGDTNFKWVDINNVTEFDGSNNADATQVYGVKISMPPLTTAGASLIDSDWEMIQLSTSLNNSIIISFSLYNFTFEKEIAEYVEGYEEYMVDDAAGKGLYIRMRDGYLEVDVPTNPIFYAMSGGSMGESIFYKIESNVTIADNLNRIIQAKADIKSAIEDKGVSVGDITIDGYAAKIAEIEGGVSDTTLEKNAIVLDITKNGTYYTKYADLPAPVYTGDDGFRGYASMTATGGGTGSLSTNYIGDEYSVVELWFRHFGNNSGNNAIVQRYYFGGSYRLMVNGLLGIFEVGTARYEITLPTDEFLHIKFSNNGFWINDELVLDNLPLYTASQTNTWEIGGSGNCGIGDYGMIKIDDNVYIPTENGFINQSTGEALPYATSAPFAFTYNEIIPPFTYNNLIKQVNVNTKINVHEYQIKLAYSSNSTIPEWLDFSNISGEDLVRFFQDSSITSLNGLENIDTSKLTSLKNTFNSCSKLSDISPIYNWDVSNVTDMSYLFYSCNNLTNIDVSNWDTGKVRTMERMIYYNSNIVSLGAIYCGAIATKNYYPLYNCNNLTDVGGFIDMKMSWDNSYGLTKCPNLTYESCINVLNGLYDFVGNSETLNSNQGVLKVHANFLTTVGDEISIATNKGWQVIS